MFGLSSCWYDGTTSSCNSTKEPTHIGRSFRKPAGSWYVILQIPENPLDQMDANGGQITRSWLSTESIYYTGYIASVAPLLSKILVIFTQNKNYVVSQGYIFSFANSSFHPLHLLKKKNLVYILLWSEVSVPLPNTDRFIAGFGCFAEPE